MLKVILIGLLIMSILGILIVFPFFMIGLLITAFCVWRGWFLAAGIIFFIGIVLQISFGANHLEGDPYGGFDDVGNESRDDPDFIDFVVGYKIYDHFNDKDKDS